MGKRKTEGGGGELFEDSAPSPSSNCTLLPGCLFSCWIIHSVNSLIVKELWDQVTHWGPAQCVNLLRVQQHARAAGS